ncbi:MAG: hypothetical protein QXD95_05220 [Nitrososphaeria archaeon]
MVKYLLFLLLFFVLNCKNVYSLEIDYFDIQRTNSFQFKYIDSSFFRIHKLKDIGNFSHYLLFSNIDFESNSTCSDICVYILNYAGNRTSWSRTVPFSRVKKAVIRGNVISFDVAKVDSNIFYLFVLDRGFELRVYTVKLNGPSREFLEVVPFFKSKISSQIGQIIIPYNLSYSGRGQVIDFLYEVEDDKNKTKIIQWYKFNVSNKKLDRVASISFNIDYEVLGLSYYLINNEPFFVVIDRDKIPILKSRYCEAKIGFVPLVIFKNESTKPDFSFLGNDYRHIPGFCSGFLYNVNDKFHKIVSFCPNIDKVRFSLNKRNQEDEAVSIYGFDLTTCSLKKSDKKEDRLGLFTLKDFVSSNTLRNLKPIKNVSYDNNDVLLYETSSGIDTKELILRRLTN